MTLFNKLLEISNKTESELKQSLNLEDDFNSKDLAKALGVYGLFQDKTELENYIKNKVQNKIKENEELQNELTNLNTLFDNLTNENKTLNEDFKHITSNVKNLLSSEWKRQNLPDFDFETLDIKNVNLSKLPEYIDKLVKDNNIVRPVVEPTKIENQEGIKFPSGVQVFSVGAKQIKKS